VVFFADCIKEYAKEKNFGGIYIDGNVGVIKGYSYDGTLNVPSGRMEDFARLNARNHRIFSEILKKEDPNFGTWFNWGVAGMAWRFSKDLTSHAGSGSGIPGDETDENIRAATDWKNVMILDEMQRILTSTEGPTTYPAGLLERLIGQRDFAVQKYGASTIVGYNFLGIPYDEPGPSKWAWPTVNYFTSMLTATQIHHAGGFWPSHRPAFQFQTRYSRFIWARDIKVVPVEEVERIVEVSTPEEMWWKRLVYKRKRQDGYDLIMHLVRIPPTEKWDINWVDEPSPLAGVRITADIGTAKLLTAQACRPYHFEEEQQVVQKELAPSGKTGKITVEIPPFRYHTMAVLRVQD